LSHGLYTKYEGRPFKGPEGAKVTIVEFTDYECPYCARYYLDTLRPLLADYGDRVKYVVRNLPLSEIHPQAMKAAEAAECAADQDAFWPYHDLLFERQAAFGAANLRQYAAEIGLDADVFDECLSSGRKAEPILADREAAVSYGVTGTPTLFVNGLRLEGIQPKAILGQLIDQLERESD
jgi:protein-disulfide isomerase